MSDGLGAFHLISVGADDSETSFLKQVEAVAKPASSRQIASLKELPNDIVKERTLVRLFGDANKDAMTWLGARGRASTEVAILGFADAIILEPGTPARAIGLLQQALYSAVSTSKVALDMSGAGLIVGACDKTRSIAASLARLGLKRLLIVDSDDKKSEHLAELLRKRVLGVEITPLSRSRLTQIPTEASIAVNLMTAFDDVLLEESILEDISYLNFLKKNGIWMDWTGASIERGFSDEIANSEVQVFDPDLVRAWRDASLLASAGLTAGRKAEVIVAEMLAEAGVKHSS